MRASIRKITTKVEKIKLPRYDFQNYWASHEYDNAAEKMAIKRLVKGQHFKKAVDVGGGYGRLSNLLTNFTDKVVLAEPSEQQLKIAAIYLKDKPQVERRAWPATNLKLKDKSVDLVLVVRVLHHLPNPSKEFAEIARVLKPGGVFLLEFANDAHFLNRLRYGVRGKKVPITNPIGTKRKSSSNYISHHPKKIIKQLQESGFELEAALSGSNLRLPAIKRILGKNIMMGLEKVLQPMLAPVYFGPSVWLKLKKR